MTAASMIRSYLQGQASLVEKLASAGHVFIASDADEDDVVTGQTSFATTTPTFLLDVPSGTTAMPLFVSLTQAGTVAGGAITIAYSIDDVDRYASGGTEETAMATRTSGASYAQACKLYSGPTATDTSGKVIFKAVTAADVEPAEGAVQGPYWSADVPIFLVGPAAFLIHTWAASTGPTWGWSIGWGEFATTSLPLFEV